MTWLWVLVIVFVVLGSLLALAESALTRMSRVRALALQEEGRRNAALLVRLETDPPRYLNSVYLSVLIVQNGSAILVAFLAERTFDSLGVTLVSLGFTLLYFVLVEAMAKTFGVLHSDRVALVLSPLVYLLGRVLSFPTRAADRPRERPAARQGSEAGAVRLRGGDPLDGRGGSRGGVDRGGREGADPLDLRVRGHDRA